MEKPCQKRILAHITKYIYIYIYGNVSSILKPTTPTQRIFLKTALFKPAVLTVLLALSALLLHSYGQALRNVTNLLKLYFVTDLGASP